MLNHPMILGMQWFNQTKPKIDWVLSTMSLLIDDISFKTSFIKPKPMKYMELCSVEQFY